MTRKVLRKKLKEMSRRMYLQQHGTLKGFGKTEKWYDDNWRVKDWNACKGYGMNSYKDIWESEPMKAARESVGM